MYKYRFSCVEDLTKIYVEEKVKFLLNKNQGMLKVKANHPA